MKTKNITKTTMTLAAIAMATIIGSADGATLLVNGDFETDGALVNGSDATGWTKEGAYGLYDGIQHGNGPVYAGLRDYTPGLGPNTTVGVYQVLSTPLTAGVEYRLTFQTKGWSAGAGNDVRIGKFNGGPENRPHDVDANYTSLSLSVLDVPSNHTVWELRSYTFTALGGEDTLYFGTGIGGGNNGADIDNVVLEVIPEPSAPVLLALSLVGLCCSRQRRHRQAY